MLCIGIFLILASSSPQSILADHKLRVVTLPIAPFFFQNQDGSHYGYIPDLIDVLLEKVNKASQNRYSAEIYIAPDRQYGRKQADGTWNGMIGEVLNEAADFTAAPLGVTAERRDVVEFAYPFMYSLIVPLVKKPVDGSPLPFSNLTQMQQQIQQGQYAVGYYKGGFTDDFIRTHNLSWVQSMYNASNGVATYALGMQLVRDGNNRYIMYGEDVYFEYAMKQGACDLALDFGGKIGGHNFAFAFAKTKDAKELMEKFNAALVEIEENGTLWALYEKWWYMNKGQC